MLATNRRRAIPAESTRAGACLFAGRHPAIGLEIARVHRDAWRLFKPHHYLSGELNKAAKCFVAFLVEETEERGEKSEERSNVASDSLFSPRSSLFDGTAPQVLSTYSILRPAAFTAVLHAPDRTGGYWREHRTVCLPDFQGVGIGNALSEFVAALFVATGKRYCSRTSHPAMIRHRANSNLWRMSRAPSFGSKQMGSCATFNRSAALDRLTAGFRFVGPPNFDAARRFGIIASRPEHFERAEGKRVP